VAGDEKAEDKKKDRRRLARRRLRRMRELARQRKALEEKARGSAAGGKPSAAASSTAPPFIERRRKDARGTSEDREKQKQSEIDALERNVAELSRLTDPTESTAADIERIRREVEELKHDFYEHLESWQHVLLARHPQRPYTDDFIRLLFENFSEIHGDRGFADDPALITGMAWFHGKPVMIVGSQKGRDTKQRVARNFGQAKPEGYRKALRAMQLAAKYRRPILVFIDTPGADRPKRLRTTCGKCRGCRCRSS
jgi:acetyl-CoA carboxylase carboxyltransferase alpha subunit